MGTEEWLLSTKNVWAGWVSESEPVKETEMVLGVFSVAVKEQTMMVVGIQWKEGDPELNPVEFHEWDLQLFMDMWTAVNVSCVWHIFTQRYELV